MRNIYKLSCALMFSCLSAYAQQDSAIVAKGERLLNLGYGVTVKAKRVFCCNIGSYGRRDHEKCSDQSSERIVW